MHGRCDVKFAAVQEAFAANFREHGEIGAAVCIAVEGRTVIDIWAGSADAARTRDWNEDTIVNVFSVGKAMASLCVLMLLEEGALELAQPVARYWPEFAAAGKEAITVQALLSHRAGLPALRRALAPEAIYDWQAMTGALAAEQPWWQPDTQHGYHVNTFGFLIGELVRRVSGEPIGAFFKRRVAQPLGADFHFGLPAEHHGRVAEFTFPEIPDFKGDVGENMVFSAYFNPPGVSGNGTVNTPAWREAEMPSGNGHSNARAVARIYSALAAVDGVSLLAADTLALATTEFSGGHDAVLDRPSRFGLGFQLTQPERPLGPGQRSFGHFGAGGSLGFADPDSGVAFGYTTNQGLGPRWQNPRNRGLVDALYSALNG
jgi:CubicO group peptidase (beta-lactamase class C family)